MGNILDYKETIIYDISVPLHQDLIVWPGDSPIKIESLSSINSQHECNTSSIQISSHAGTHIDAPSHFINGGKSVDSIPLELLIGKCIVIEVSSKSLIEIEDLSGYNFCKYKRVLFKTRNSEFWPKSPKGFSKNFVSLSTSAALYLTQFGVFLIGIDYLSIESFYSKKHSVHNILLRKEVVILEGIDLSKVVAGEYNLICLPLKVIDCDGAPARAILEAKYVE